MPYRSYRYLLFAPNAELSRPPKGDRLELLVLPERSEGKEFDTAQLRIPPERSEGGTLGFRRSPLAARRPASRCSVTRALEPNCQERLQTAKS